MFLTLWKKNSSDFSAFYKVSVGYRFQTEAKKFRKHRQYNREHNGLADYYCLGEVLFEREAVVS